MSPQEGTVPMSATPASPDFSLLSFIADSHAMVMLFSNGTAQVSDQSQRSRRLCVTSERCETQGSYPVSSAQTNDAQAWSGSQTAGPTALGNLVSLGTV